MPQGRNVRRFVGDLDPRERFKQILERHSADRASVTANNSGNGFSRLQQLERATIAAGSLDVGSLSVERVPGPSACPTGG